MEEEAAAPPMGEAAAPPMEEAAAPSMEEEARGEEGRTKSSGQQEGRWERKTGDARRRCWLGCVRGRPPLPPVALVRPP